MSTETPETVKSVELTEEQKLRIEQNRQKALERRNQRLVAHPYAKNLKSKQTEENSFFSVDPNVIKVSGKKVIDSGGGFLLEEDDDLDEAILREITEDPAPILIESDKPTCLECSEKFSTSYLFETFDYPACDNCRDNDDKHALITKTDARKEYALKDCDIEKREPPLKFIERKNPHNPRWGTMRLYLQVQVEKRALEVWGSEDNLREHMEKKDEKRVMVKTKKYKKEMKQLRMAVRSSLYDKTTKASHEHEFGADKYNEDDDNYTHACKSCGFEETFEKM